jgi:hypothetical protein
MGMDLKIVREEPKRNRNRRKNGEIGEYDFIYFKT